MILAKTQTKADMYDYMEEHGSTSVDNLSRHVGIDTEEAEDLIGQMFRNNKIEAVGNRTYTIPNDEDDEE